MQCAMLAALGKHGFATNTVLLFPGQRMRLQFSVRDIRLLDRKSRANP
jgi:hypothetical protein